MAAPPNTKPVSTSRHAERRQRWLDPYRLRCSAHPQIAFRRFTTTTRTGKILPVDETVGRDTIAKNARLGVHASIAPSHIGSNGRALAGTGKPSAGRGDHDPR